MKLQLKELASDNMLKTMFPNLNILATISLSIPVNYRLGGEKFLSSKINKKKTLLRSSLSKSWQMADIYNQIIQTVGKQENHKIMPCD